MSMDIPLSYRLDCNRLLLDSIYEDTPDVLMEVVGSFHATNHGRAIAGAADLLTGTDTIEDKFNSAAFFSAGAIACAAFMESDAPKPLIVRTMKSFSMRSVPVTILCDSPEKTFEAFNQLALEGHRSHPELRAHTDEVMEYYAQMTPQAGIGRIAFLGAGYSLYQLDRAWNVARESFIDEVVAEEAAGVDWDRVF